LFATAVTLVLIPANVLIVQDIKRFFKKIFGVRVKTFLLDGA
jgi:hypothetical protein